jgi:TPR repeat protein
MIKKIVKLSLLCMTIVGTMSFANTVALDEYKKGNYKEAVVAFEAEENSKDKNFYLGILYWTGKGVERDIDKGSDYWQSGWDLGDERSAISLGLSLLNSKQKGGIDILIEVANTGYRDAEYELGKVYYDNRSKHFDIKKAFTLFVSSAEKGRAAAQANLGLMYYYGEGVGKDMQKSKYWYQKAAENGFDNAKYALGVILLEEKDSKAVDWLESAAGDGHLGAIMTLADHYQQKGDFEKSIFWFGAAVKAGESEAVLPLAILKYDNGDELDKREGLRLISQCTVAGDKTCMSILLRIWSGNKNRARIAEYMQKKFK